MEQDRTYQICSECQSYMITHQRDENYLKCPTCGFCKPQKTYPKEVLPESKP